MPRSLPISPPILALLFFLSLFFARLSVVLMNRKAIAITVCAVSQISDINPVGTIAYLYEEESLLVRVRKGWQYISVSYFLPGKQHTTFS
jgi:Collagen trimerization domain